MEINRAADMNALLDAADRCISKSGFKQSTQLFETDELLKCYDIRREMLDGEYATHQCNEFILSERGKCRPIKAPCINDRVAEKALNMTAVMPAITPRLIHDNGASIKGKGVDFARRRFEQALHEHWRTSGAGGYMLVMDFSKYFDNIRHDEIKRQFKPLLSTPEYEVLCRIVDGFAPDVSYMSAEEYEAAMDVLYNALEHVGRHGNGEKRLGKSCNIGAELSQPIGVYYPHRIDNFIKTVCGERWYGRYMDDSYIIGDDRELLRERLEQVAEQCVPLGITLNRKKTHIIPLNKPFVWLKMKYSITETGHIRTRPVRAAFARERKRISYLAAQVKAGTASREYAVRCYRSWRENFKQYDCYKTIGSLDRMFVQMIGPF